MYNIRAKSLAKYRDPSYAEITAGTAYFIRTVVLEELIFESIRQTLACANGQKKFFRKGE